MRTIKNYREWTMDDIVFENRNKDYGGYQIRKAIPENILMAMIVIMLTLGTLVAVYVIDWHLLQTTTQEEIVETTEVHLPEPPEIVHAVPAPTPPPPPPVPPPPVRPSVRYVEMVVKKEAEISEDAEQPIPMEEIQELAIATETQTGDTAVPEIVTDIPPPVMEKEPEDTPVYEHVTDAPQFPGGTAALESFISAAIRYPDMERYNGIEGTVLVRFVVMEDGSVSDVHTQVRGRPSFEKEAVRVIKTLPRFQPGKLYGRAVRVYYHIPVKFDLKSL